MKLYPMDSTAIKAAAYDRSNNTMLVQFQQDGEKVARVYRYLRVPRSVYVSMRKARHQGKYYHRNVKGKYESQRLLLLGDYLIPEA